MTIRDPTTSKRPLPKTLIALFPVWAKASQSPWGPQTTRLRRANLQLNAANVIQTVGSGVCVTSACLFVTRQPFLGVRKGERKTQKKRPGDFGSFWFPFQGELRVVFFATQKPPTQKKQEEKTNAKPPPHQKKESPPFPPARLLFSKGHSDLSAGLEEVEEQEEPLQHLEARLPRSPK